MLPEAVIRLTKSIRLHEPLQLFLRQARTEKALLTKALPGLRNNQRLMVWRNETVSGFRLDVIA
jgi:hypothetical protein